METEHDVTKTPIRALCAATGLTTAQIADELGITPDTARSLSCGRLPTSERLLRKIAFLFGVELRTLFEAGDAVMTRDGLPLTPQRWQLLRAELERFEERLADNIERNPLYHSPLLAELNASLARAADRGDLLARYADIHAFLRAE